MVLRTNFDFNNLVPCVLNRKTGKVSQIVEAQMQLMCSLPYGSIA